MGRYLKVVLPIFTGLGLVVFGVFAASSPILATGTQHCPSGWESKDEGSPFSYTAASDQNVGKLCIKAGTQIFEYTTNGSDGCYSRSGLGTGAASATKVGSGPSCKDISYVAFYTQVNHSPTPTPSPSSSPSSSPSPLPSPTPSPSSSPEASPSPTPTSSPCVTCGGDNTNTNTNTNENTQEQTQTNNQTVNITITESQVLGAKTPTVQPETGVSVLELATMLGAGPLGLFLARYGRGKIKSNKKEGLTSFANEMVARRTLCG